MSFVRGQSTLAALAGVSAMMALGVSCNAWAQIEIASIEDLQKIGRDAAYALDGDYVLTQDIDASGTADWNDGAGFQPIGAGWTDALRFGGTFDGQGHTISGLRVARPNGDGVGLFASVRASGQILNTHLEETIVLGRRGAGGLVGSNKGMVRGCRVTGEVAGYSFGIGGLVGCNYGTVMECSAGSTVRGAAGYVGGLVGRNEGTVTKCHSSGLAMGYGVVGGLVGENCATVAECCATGAVTGRSVVGGLVGHNSKGAVTHCYAVGRVDGYGESVGGLVGSNDATVTACFWDTETTGQGQSAAGTGLSTVEMMQAATFVDEGWDLTDTDDDPPVWTIIDGLGYPFLHGSVSPSERFELNITAVNGNVLQQPDGEEHVPSALVWLTPQPGPGYAFAGWIGPGLGTQAAYVQSPLPVVMTEDRQITAVFLPDAPVIIEDVESLQRIGSGPDWPLHWHYLLVRDMEASTTADWNGGAGFDPIGGYGLGFTGVLDGQGHILSGLCIKRPDDWAVGLFKCVGPGGEVKDIVLEGGSVSGYYGVGGVAGENYGSVCGCRVTVEVNAEGDAGCVAGWNGGTVAYCLASGEVMAYQTFAGGLLGSNGGTVVNCHATGNVETVDYGYTGGLVASNGGTLTGCSASGDVVGCEECVGGLVGQNGGSVTDCHAIGPVDGYLLVGGLVGANSGTLTRCYATGEVLGCQNVGGLVGSNYGGTVTECYSTNEIEAHDSVVGGLVGYSSGTLVKCFAMGGITASFDWVGGLVGINASNGTLSECCAVNAVDGRDEVGGLVGSNYGAVTNCYALGATSGRREIGGLAGANSGVMTYSYAAGAVSGDAYLGGVTSWTSEGSVLACRWDIETTGRTRSGGGTGRTTAEMMQAATFVDAGWDFETVWGIDEGLTYPYLLNVPPSVEGEGEGEGEDEGEGEGEGAMPEVHSADQDGDNSVNLSELLRVIQLHNVGGYQCRAGTEDGYAPGLADQHCMHHASDCAPRDWTISLSEVLRLVQFFNIGGYHPCEGSEDGYCPGQAARAE